MCYECHGNVDIKKQFSDILKSEDYYFDKWNVTSVNHLIISMSNHDGEECRTMAIEIFNRFLKWYKNNMKDNYFPEWGMEQMYSISCLENILKIATENPDEEESVLTQKFQEEIDFCRNNVEQVTLGEINDRRRQKENNFYTIIGGIGLVIALYFGFRHYRK